MPSSSGAFSRPEARTPSPQLGGPLLPNRPNIPRTDPQTPRRRKPTASVRLQGIKTTMPNNLSTASISRRLISTLKLQYTPDDWQVHLIHRILQGFDSIFCAGTGYGKSLVFEGLAALGGKGKLVIIISPLKALERDQARLPIILAEQAKVKGIDVLVINEDTTKTADLWKHARTGAAMVYMSPEMALSPSFQKLWKDPRFRTRLTAIVVDEAHCIAEWGGEDFRPAYRLLETLRSYTGHEVPVVACTATCTTQTFDLIWTTLGYGHRPFWGLDVGSDRPNLLYITRILENPKNPLLDILNLLPNDLAASSPLDAIPKCIFYFDSEDACRKAVQFIRKCLPEHLRKSVHAFSSNMSELAKEQCWELFSKGEFRIICATDAAGMGCNVSDVKYIVTFGLTKSLGTISQRWGRAGRDRATEGVCLWLVPKWAFRPQQPSTTNPIVQRLQSSKNNRPLETKHETVQRAKLDPILEDFINIGLQTPPGCSHAFLRDLFHPQTGLTTYSTLDRTGPSTIGPRSQSSAFEMTWTVLDLKRTPPTTRCCQHCNRELVDAYSASTTHDHRIQRFAPEFLFPILPPQSRPSSSLSLRSAISTSTTSFVPISTGYKVPIDEQERLRARLIQWRERLHVAHGSPLFFSSQIFFPPKQLNLLVSECNKYLEAPIVDARFLRKLIQWDSAGNQEWDEVAQLIMEWREGVRPPATPTSQRRARKKARAPVEGARTPVVQPDFQALHVTHSRSMPPLQQSSATHSHFTTPLQQPSAINFFQTPRSTPPPRRSSDINIFQTARLPGPLNSPPMLPTTPHPRPFYPAHGRSLFQPQSTPSPSHILTNPYYQLISPQPIIYPQMPYPSPALTPTILYNQTPPGTVTYQTPAVPPSSLRFSYYNPQMPH